MIDFIRQQIAGKWTPMEVVCGDSVEGKPEYLKAGLYFNYIFRPVQIKKIDCELEMHPELLEIYKLCNGLRLFLSGFCIYGFQENGRMMEPFDIRIENINIHERMKDNRCDIEELVFFGSVCNDFVFAYNRNNMGKILCMENGKSEVIKSFDSISDTTEYFVPRIIQLYDSNYKKVLPNKEFNGIPVLENSAMDIIEIL